jgi:glutamate N-acetyltransferase/amino-acid N-acetyltransferase
VVVRGGNLEGAEAVARSVANSPLVKAALHSGDPNWGRIVQAVGAAMGGRDRFSPPLAVDITLEGIHVCSTGTSIDYDEGVLEEALKAKEVEYEITLGGRDVIHVAETEVFFSDLSHEYVTINADYTT